MYEHSTNTVTQRMGRRDRQPVAASRMEREVLALEAALRAVERAASRSRPGTLAGPEPPSDVASRLSELERREFELQQRERAVEHHRGLLLEAQDRLIRGKGRLKRAVARFHAELRHKTEQLDARARQLAAARADLVEARRESTRQQMRLKAVQRDRVCPVVEP